MARKNWTREELIVVFNLYCQLPFSVTNAKRKEVVDLASLIGRTPSAVSWKLVNFASLDPSLQAQGIKGASNGSKADKVIFDEFSQNWEKMIYESELILSNLKNNQLQRIVDIDNDIKKIDFIDMDNFLYQEKEGLAAEKLVKIRANQNFFRKMILSAYENKCCLTGLNIPSLLVASHIVPWSKDESNRLNPENGLCLNNLHDKAFDRGLITVDFDYTIKVSSYLQDLQSDESLHKFFFDFDKKPIILPKRFLPNKEFLDYHHRYIFKG
ncbi:restriction endonuclease [Moraxella macacae 0408225]|uniref:Restriction endonuclease n=1 Tax=Moraxella macacae 0408225 TaxID=1230338 RepID=L2F6V7_9GAMM|nr:HNH endonuclease [Moraxella macacae]ELA08814.1 restriction endonuclease [Moraxella macacae 0408225]